MKIIADAGCYLTEAAEVAFDKRTFRYMVITDTVEEADGWKQVTSQQKAEMEEQAAIFGSQDITPEYLGKVDTLMAGIAERINDTPMTVEQSLKNKKYYPQRKDIIGKPVNVGFRLNEGETMYEVIQPHTISEEWIHFTRWCRRNTKVLKQTQYRGSRVWNCMTGNITPTRD